MFIVFDGMDRSGKSTQIKLMVKWLAEQKIDFLSVREPGGTNFAEKIRLLIKEESPDVIDPVAQLLLFFLSRHDLTKKLLNIKQNYPFKLILCDRFIDSTYAYQGQFFSQNQIDFLKNLIANIEPDFVFLFLENYGHEKDHMDIFAKQHKTEIIQRFKQRANLHPDKYFIVPAGDVSHQHVLICEQFKKLIYI